MRPQVLADDALIVLPAPLSRGTLLQPVGAELVERPASRIGIAKTLPDLLGLDDAPAELELRRLEVFEDGALAFSGGIEPADAPCRVGFAMGLLVFPASKTSPPLKWRRAPLRHRVAPKLSGPNRGPSEKREVPVSG